MKRMLLGLGMFVAMGAMAAEEQSGVPARLEAINGKQARVFLQRLEDGKLTFQAYKSKKDITVEATKIKSLSFFAKYDAESVVTDFNTGDYAAVIATLDPLMEPYWEYMVVDNTLREAFCMLMDAHRKSGDFPKVLKAADLLMASDDPDLVQRGQINTALAALAAGDLGTAEKIRSEVDSAAAGLYLQASIERANGQPKTAIQTVSTIIAEHANAIEWLGPSELLCAYLYMDMIGSTPGITTNSARTTARQVKNIYAGSSEAADAEKLWASLGGREIEAAIEKAKAEKKAADKIAWAERKAEEKAIQEAEEAAAAAAEVAGTNVTTTTEMEAE